MIPPGPHFVYYGSSNREGREFSPIVGFFITPSYSEVVVRKWNQQEEQLVKLSEEEEARYSAAVKHLEFDNQLGPYPLDQFGKWVNLSKYITKDLIERLEPIGGEITIAYEPQLIDAIPKESMARDVDHLRNNKLARSPEESKKQSCYYTPIPRVIKQKGTPLKELTALNLDKTELLETILRNNFRGCEDLLLGELQFAFIAFLMAQVLEAFYQWKALVSLLFSCTDATELLETILRNNFRGCEDLLLGELQFAFIAFLMAQSLEAFYQWKALVSLLFSCTDATELLETILRNNFRGCEDLLLGELQFAFIAFLMAQSLEAFYQWKALVSLLFSCTDAPLHSRSRLFMKFIRLIYYQLKHGCSDDKTGTDMGSSLFFDDTWLSKDIFLYRLCKEFISLTQEAIIIDGDLLSWVKKLKGLLEKSFGWDFHDTVADMIYDEEDEYAPVVVLSTDMTSHEDQDSQS